MKADKTDICEKLFCKWAKEKGLFIPSLSLNWKEMRICWKRDSSWKGWKAGWDMSAKVVAASFKHKKKKGK